MSFSGACRFVSLGAATLFLLLGVGLTITGLVTPAWQTVQLSRGSYHEHGLWLDCFKDDDESPLRCNYKFFEDAHEHEHKNTPEQHRLYDWHKVTLYLLVGSVVAAFVALLFSFCAPCVKITAVVWNIFCLLAFILSTVALVLFFSKSHRKEYRLVDSPTGDNPDEQQTGYSFGCAVAGSFFYLLTFLMSVIGTIVIFIHDRHQVYNHKTWPKHHTAV